MKPWYLIAALSIGCASSAPPVASLASPPNPPPAPTTAPPPSPPQEPCPTSLSAASGKSCGMEGQSCGDPDREGWSISCIQGAWRGEPTKNPPCCKK